MQVNKKIAFQVFAIFMQLITYYTNNNLSNNIEKLLHLIICMSQ